MTAAAALALLAAFLLAPDAAWGQQLHRNQCGGLATGTRSCDDQAYAIGIYYATSGANSFALTVGGGTATTVTASGTRMAGIALRTADSGATGNLDLIVGSAGAVTIVDGGNNANGIFLNQQGTGTATLDVKGTVTIGSSGARMGMSGIQFINVDRGTSTGNVRVESAAAIYSSLEGIYVAHLGTGSATTSVSNRGAIDANRSAFYVRTTGSGAMTVSNSGNLKAAGVNRRGIELRANGNGAITLTLTGGRIESTAAQGVYVESQGTGAIAIRGTPADAETPSSATITAATHGIHVQKIGSGATAGAISIATTGGSITTGDGDGIFVEDNADYDGSIAIDNAADITADRYGILVDRAGMGAVSVTNSGGAVLGKTEAGIRAENAGDSSDVTVAVMGGMVRSTGRGGSTSEDMDVNALRKIDNLSGQAIYARNRGTGDVIVTIAAGATASSRQDAGIFASLGSYDSQVKVTQGGAILGRTGVLARAPHHATAETVAPRPASAQPVIDVVWTGAFADGNTAHTAANDDDRLVAATANDALYYAREVAAATSTRTYGAPAGIEAQVMPWRIVAQNVATGEGHVLYPDLAAQEALFDSTSSQELQARGDAIVAQFRAVLENDQIDASAVVAAVEAAMPDGGAPDGELSDAEIKAYLQTDDTDTRSLLTGVLTLSLSEAEQRVLQAMASGDSARLDAALDAHAAFSDGYKTAMRGLLDRYNVGNIRIAMDGGSIASRGDGIRAYYATPHANNGRIDVTVAAGATVTGGVAGIKVANAGLGPVGKDSEWARFLELESDADNVRQQFVTVNGKVTGGTDAAVHLTGGGMLLVGETGEVHAGASVEGASEDASGVGVLVNDPGDAYVTIHGLVRGGEGGAAAVHLTGGGGVAVGPTGRVMDNGAAAAIRTDEADTPVIVYVPGNEDVEGAVSRQAVESLRERVTGPVPAQTRLGVYDAAGPTGGVGVDPLPRNDDGTIGLDPTDYDWAPCPVEGHVRGDDDMCRAPVIPEPEPMGFDCDEAAKVNDRCRMYEALPSMLLAMNGLPTWGERMSAARDARGGWARVEAARGKWKADTSTRENVAYDHRRSGVRAGMDFAVGDAGRVGVSVHGLRGSAEMAQGEVDLSGSGLGVHGTAALAGGIYLDAQAAATWYEADLKSAVPVRGPLKNDANGRGYALGVEVGKRLPAMDGGVTLTPRAGLRWSKAGLSDFDEEVMAGARVSVKDARSLRGRAGVGAEKTLDGVGGWTGARLFGSLDVEQEFREETEARVSGRSPGSPATSLKAGAKKTRIRAAAGGVRVWDEGRYVLQGSMGYTAGGGDNREFGGGLSLRIRF